MKAFLDNNLIGILVLILGAGIVIESWQPGTLESFFPPPKSQAVSQ